MKVLKRQLESVITTYAAFYQITSLAIEACITNFVQLLTGLEKMKKNILVNDTKATNVRRFKFG